jgi:hypothetical protein
MSNVDWDFFSGVHHFYSPIPSLNFIEKYDDIVSKYKEINDIDLNIEGQLFNLEIFKSIYKKIPWLTNNNFRYKFDNMYYSYTDGIILYSMIMKNKPKKIIEIGRDIHLH